MNLEEMNLDEIQTRKAEIMTRREAIEAELESSDALDALKEEAEALNAEERALNERETAIEKAAEARAKEIAEVMQTGEEVKKPEERKVMSNLEVRKSVEYANAWANYIKTGDDTECRALLTENVTGSVPVSTYAEDRVRTAWQRDGIIFNGVVTLRRFIQCLRFFRWFLISPFTILSSVIIASSVDLCRSFHNASHSGFSHSFRACCSFPSCCLRNLRSNVMSLAK